MPFPQFSRWASHSPLNPSRSTSKILPPNLSSAAAKGGEGNGGGNGGGNAGGNGGGNGGGNAGGNSGGNAGAKGGDHGGELRSAGHSGEAARSGKEKGSDRASFSGRGPQASGEARSSGQGRQLGLVEGFLSDLRQDHKAGRSRTPSARTEKEATRETKTVAKDRTIAASVTGHAKVSASSLGRLNAAHASPQALANAASNSTVGRIAAYRAAIEEDDLTAAADVLAALSNKPVSAESVRAFNELLGVSLSDEEISELLDKAMAPAVVTAVPQPSFAVLVNATTTTWDASLGRLNAAHASHRALDRAATSSAVGQVAAYKSALDADDLEKAATALAAASNKPVTGPRSGT